MSFSRLKSSPSLLRVSQKRVIQGRSQNVGGNEEKRNEAGPSTAQRPEFYSKKKKIALDRLDPTPFVRSLRAFCAHERTAACLCWESTAAKTHTGEHSEVEISSHGSFAQTRLSVRVDDVRNRSVRAERRQGLGHKGIRG
nr:hypothetical protein CFP56_57871 [Quercus suber]